MLRVVLLLLFAGFLYILIAGGFILAHNPVEPVTEQEASLHRRSLTEGGDSTQANVALVEGNTFAGLARVDLIRRATDTLEVSSHQVTGGKGADVFFAEILAAAERGVDVRIVLDGIFAGMRRLSDGLEDAVLAHPNIHVALYEPLDLIRPWTIQNRFHDKMIIVDGAMLLTGGRNIGSRYFFYELEDNSGTTPLRDRDVLVFADGGMQDTTREDVPLAVTEAREYFERIWRHEWTQERKQPAWDSETADAGAEEEAWIQSPFFVTNSPMETILETFPRDNQVLLTNAPATNPNWFAVSGYLNQRTEFASGARTLYEYQGADSIHAKAWLIDERYSFIGAFNMDPRSAFLSTESMLFIQSEEFGRQHRRAMERITEESLAVTETDGALSAIPKEGVDVYEAGPVKRVALPVMRVFARPLVFLL